MITIVTFLTMSYSFVAVEVLPLNICWILIFSSLIIQGLMLKNELKIQSTQQHYHLH